LQPWLWVALSWWQRRYALFRVLLRNLLITY